MQLVHQTREHGYIGHVGDVRLSVSQERDQCCDVATRDSHGELCEGMCSGCPSSFDKVTSLRVGFEGLTRDSA